MPYVIHVAPERLIEERLMINSNILNPEYDLCRQLANALDKSKTEAGALTMELLGNYAATVANYVSDLFAMVLREKYCAIWQLARNEVIHKVITECSKSDYVRAQKYLNDFMDLHAIFQSIVVRNNFKQNIISVIKENHTIEAIDKDYVMPCLVTATNNREVIDTGNISVFLFDLKDKKGKIGTLEVGISVMLIAEALRTAQKRIPYFRSMCMADNSGQILYPGYYSRKSCITRELMSEIRKQPSGFYLSEKTPSSATGYATIAELPFRMTSGWIIICELQVNDVK